MTVVPHQRVTCPKCNSPHRRQTGKKNISMSVMRFYQCLQCQESFQTIESKIIRFQDDTIRKNLH